MTVFDIQRSWKARRRPVLDAGLWFIFFAIIYLVFLLKLTSGSYLNYNFFFISYSILIVLYILSRFVLSFLHRKMSVDLSYEPTVSFVVPAKNEEDNIYETLTRFAKVDYPKEKIEVIAIDDGSTDRTLAEMERAARYLEQTVANVGVVSWHPNRGKRHGMHEGVKRSKNEIIIFIDSDSFVDPACVRHLVKYFSIPDIGAVSGHTDVYNRNTNMLTQMQALRYYIAFKVYKAAESIFGIVTCCPGCCSAYRKAYVDPIIDEWLNQKFLGKECTFGDDRSLTNFILRKYRAAYSSEAKAYTVVPDDFRKYMRQQQRWKKSWVRETAIAATFIWRKDPFAAIFFYTYIFLAFSSPIVFIHAALWNPVIHRIIPGVYFFGLFLMLMLHGVYYRIHVGPRKWLTPVIAFWFYTVVLIWQLPWAFFTIADSRWGTR